MDKNSSQKKMSKKNIKRKKVRWLISITSFLTIIIFSYIWYDDSIEEYDLSLIGKGKNVIVQIHDPG